MTIPVLAAALRVILTSHSLAPRQVRNRDHEPRRRNRRLGMNDDPHESLHKEAGPLPRWSVRLLIVALAATAASFLVFVAGDQAGWWRPDRPVAAPGVVGPPGRPNPLSPDRACKALDGTEFPRDDRGWARGRDGSYRYNARLILPSTNRINYEVTSDAPDRVGRVVLRAEMFERPRPEDVREFERLARELAAALGLNGPDDLWAAIGKGEEGSKAKTPHGLLTYRKAHYDGSHDLILQLDVSDR